MTQPQPAKPKSDPSKVIVFGVDDDCKPHAAWFSKDHADKARTAARQLRLNLIEVTNGTAADLIGKVPPGRIHAAGSGMVPFVREDLYAKLVASLNSKGEAGRSNGEPSATEQPATWDAIKPGHVVLVQDTLVDGWWEVIVVERSGDKISLRWRDYPGWPKFTVPATAIALLHPKAS